MCFKLCASFHSQQWIQTGVTAGNAQCRSKSMIFFVPCDLKLDRWPCRTLGHLFKLCASFRRHWWIQTGSTVRKHLIWVKINFFWPCDPRNLTDDLEKHNRISLKYHQALCIISSSYVNSNWSYGPWTAKLGRTDGQTEPFIELLGRS